MAFCARVLLWGACMVWIGPAAGWACSVCLPGDPVFSSTGSTAQELGEISAFVQWKTWQKTSGALEHGHEEEEEEEDHHGGTPREKNESQQVDLFLSWTPIDRVTLTLNVPFAFNKTTEFEEGQQETSTLSGLGDVILSSSVVFWRNRPVLPSTWFEARAFLKFPTGESSERVDGVKDPHLQPGTGSWDFGFGLAGVHRLEWASLFASVIYRENTEGSLDYEYGDVVLANLGMEVPLGHALERGWLNPVTFGTELNFRYAGYDEFQGARYRDSGGAILYVTPSVRIRLPFAVRESQPSLRAAVQIPTNRTWLHNRQSEDPIYSIGLLYTF